MKIQNANTEVVHISESSLPHLAIDCVILGYNSDEKNLKVLLLTFKGAKEWFLPGGFVLKDEPVDNAACRVLQFRTGLKNIYLKQFAIFGDPDRAKNKKGDNIIDHPWFNQRFVSIGYYALVDYRSVHLTLLDMVTEQLQWRDIDNLPEMGLDHQSILKAGLESLRKSLNLHPVGFSLLPESFTLPELQSLYEIILGRKLNRGNFYRKIMNYDLLIDRGEMKQMKGHRSPKLYSFNKEVYEDAVKNGLQSIW